MTLRFLLALFVLFAAGTAQAQVAPFRSDRIVVEVQGRGPDVILIPGLASTAEVWRRTADRLDDRYRVHLVSVRGFGDLPVGANQSGAISGPVAGEVRRYIASQGLSRPALIGHSMGGQIALRIAADARDGVGRVMVVDASPFFPALVNPGATVGDIEPIAQIAYQALIFFGDQALVDRGRALRLELGNASEALFNGMGWQGGDRRVLARGLYEVMTLDLRHRLPDITAPVTVVYGWSRDDRSPRRDIDRLLRAAYSTLRRPARFEPIEGAEHMVMIDQPTRFMAAVERFLA
ncbi:alpha/beta hydrolase [Brevundimonas vitis]|uniref:Alpha/beta hydrolase n=1 Tax=Brevundimonas vitisensis TaxID=2800818 RepID=A0ABX7BU37_9CAUL|nr:alpha/beta hydrolase [Brevundimonas vitisensis]QQQ19801.1 alpha/beta hydrolase [Brevundimonas vitisensis]